MNKAQSDMPDQLTAGNRQIRVFISSTFRDMQAERDHLVKFIFPQLRKLCESRGVTWGEVDLRWGVTDEQAAEGKVLPICLEEIKRCRPYFIGLLGERYGWISDALPADLVEREKWLEEHLHGKTSVTELEILHGVLNDPQMAGHAFFYFRDPAYLDKLPPGAKLEDFTVENAKDAEKLSALKDRIRQSIFPVRDGYRNPEVVGRAIRRDLTRVINRLWPEGSQPDPLDREAMDHEAYAQSRERVYIGRQEYFDRLDTHAAANDTQPLVILGESGSGKSALLANWVARYRQAHPDALVLQHYIGATPYSADWAAMLRRLMGEFKRRLSLQQDIPDQPEALRSAFPNWLYMAAAKGRVVLVLDALNQLEDRDGAPDLVWLPPVLPENVRLIVSTLPGRPLDEIQKRHWPTFKVELLSADERKELVRLFLKDYGRNLSPKQLERITNTPASANPLYLRVLLDELRVFGVYEKLDERIGHYLQAESPYALYEKVIARWEQDYEGDSNLVGDTLSLLWAARRGLTETELLQALGKDGEPMPRAKWSPLFLAMSDALISRGGLLTFAHDFLRTAVMNTYLPTEQSQRQTHLRLAKHFSRQHRSSRQLDEWPWQLRSAASWKLLFDLLSDLDFFAALWEAGIMDAKAYWAQLEQNSYSMVDAYASALKGTEQFSCGGVFLLPVASVLHHAGHLRESLPFFRALEEHPAVRGNPTLLTASLSAEANVLHDLGRLNEAITILEKAVAVFKKENEPAGQASALGNLAMIHYDLGNYDLGLSMAEEVERLYEGARNLHGRQRSLCFQARFHCKFGRLAKAEELYQGQKEICQQTNNMEWLMYSFGGLAQVLMERRQWDKALPLLEQKARICQQFGMKDGLSVALGNMALCFKQAGQLDRALEMHRKEEELCKELCRPMPLGTCLINQAVILREKQEFETAAALLAQARALLRQCHNPDELQRCLGEEAKISLARGDLHTARTSFQEQTELCRKMAVRRVLIGCLVEQVGALLGHKLVQLIPPLLEELLGALQASIADGTAERDAIALQEWVTVLRVAIEDGSIHEVLEALERDAACVKTQYAKRKEQPSISEQEDPRNAQGGVVGNNMKNKVISKCPKCGARLSVDPALVDSLRTLGVDGFRAPCFRCKTLLIFDVATGEASEAPSQ